MASIKLDSESNEIVSHRRHRSNSWTPVATWTPQHGHELPLRPSVSSPALTFLEPQCYPSELVPGNDSTSTMEPAVSLSDLLQVIREDVSQRRRVNTQRDLVCRRYRGLARGRNVTALAQQVKSTLTDCIRADDKASFTTLYKAATDSTRDDEVPLDWHDRLTLASRDSIVAYLKRLNDDSFLADCLSSLNQKQLLALLPTSHKVESIMGSSRSTLPLGYAVDQLVDHLTAGSASCTLDAIWNLLGHGERALDIWANVCGKLVSEQRAGGDKIMIHIMNRIAWSQSWSGRAVVEDWMLDTIEAGHFLLEQAKTFSQRMQMPQSGRGSDTHKSETFLFEAASQLLELLSTQSVIPLGVLDFSNRILNALDGFPRHQQGFPSYAATKWLFFSWLPDVVSSPEVYGLLEDQIVSENIRIKILKDVCSHTQRIVLDVTHAWRHNKALSERDVTSMQRILAQFNSQQAVRTIKERSVLAVAAEDVVAALTSLHPVQRIGSICSDQATLKSGLQSSASSISGFSLFRSGEDLSVQEEPIPHNLDAIDTNLGQAKDELEDIINADDKTYWSFFLHGSEALSCYRSYHQTVDWSAHPAWWKGVLEIAQNEELVDSARMPYEQLVTILSNTYDATYRANDLVRAYHVADLLHMLQIFHNSHGDTAVADLVTQTYLTFTALVETSVEALSKTNALTASLPDLFVDHPEDLDILRDKMWYKACVRTSGEYEQLQSLVTALKQMCKPAHRQGSPLRSMAQVLAILSVTAEYGGPNKLTSEQSVIVARWLKQNNIHNLCTIDERLHKLCMEVRKSAEVLCTLDVTANPMLWEDALYKKAQSAVLQLPIRRKDSRPAPAFWTQKSIPQALSNTSSYEYIDVKSPTLTNKSSNFWSPAVTETQSQSSATSVGSQGWAELSTKAAQRPETQLYGRIVGFLQSEFSLFEHGSETDLALWTGLGASLQQEHHIADVVHTKFSFRSAFERMWRRLRRLTNPLSKLQVLVDIQRLLLAYSPSTARTTSPSERFYTILSDSSLRPATLLRDLQYIAALLPQSSIEAASTNGAFWNAACAAARLKDERIRVIIEIADSIIAHQTNSRGSSSVAQHQRDAAVFAVPQPRADIEAYTMTDAAILLQIAARDGHAAAQRELATLYLTHPDLIDHVIAPFAQPKEVFREELENKWKTQDRTRCDPLTMCVAHHWMKLSSDGGDTLAKEFLKQAAEMDKLG